MILKFLEDLKFINSTKINTTSLDLFPIDIQTSICQCSIDFIYNDETFYTKITSQNQFSWYLTLIGHGFSLPLRNIDLARKSLEIYSRWLLTSNSPVPLKQNYELFATTMLQHISKLFEFKDPTEEGYWAGANQFTQGIGISRSTCDSRKFACGSASMESHIECCKRALDLYVDFVRSLIFGGDSRVPLSQSKNEIAYTLPPGITEHIRSLPSQVVKIITGVAKYIITNAGSCDVQQITNDIRGNNDNNKYNQSEASSTVALTAATMSEMTSGTKTHLSAEGLSGTSSSVEKSTFANALKLYVVAKSFEALILSHRQDSELWDVLEQVLNQWTQPQGIEILTKQISALNIALSEYVNINMYESRFMAPYKDISVSGSGVSPTGNTDTGKARDQRRVSPDPTPTPNTSREPSKVSYSLAPSSINTHRSLVVKWYEVPEFVLNTNSNFISFLWSKIHTILVGYISSNDGGFSGNYSASYNYNNVLIYNSTVKVFANTINYNIGVASNRGLYHQTILQLSSVKNESKGGTTPTAPSAPTSLVTTNVISLAPSKKDLLVQASPIQPSGMTLFVMYGPTLCKVLLRAFCIVTIENNGEVKRKFITRKKQLKIKPIISASRGGKDMAAEIEKRMNTMIGSQSASPVGGSSGRVQATPKGRVISPPQIFLGSRGKSTQPNSTVHQMEYMSEVPKKIFFHNEYSIKMAMSLLLRIIRLDEISKTQISEDSLKLVKRALKNNFSTGLPSVVATGLREEMPPNKIVFLEAINCLAISAGDPHTIEKTVRCYETYRNTCVGNTDDTDSTDSKEANRKSDVEANESTLQTSPILSLFDPRVMNGSLRILMKGVEKLVGGGNNEVYNCLLSNLVHILDFATLTLPFTTNLSYNPMDTSKDFNLVSSKLTTEDASYRIENGVFVIDLCCNILENILCKVRNGEFGLGSLNSSGKSSFLREIYEVYVNIVKNISRSIIGSHVGLGSLMEERGMKPCIYTNVVNGTVTSQPALNSNPNELAENGSINGAAFGFFSSGLTMTRDVLRPVEGVIYSTWPIEVTYHAVISFKRIVGSVKILGDLVAIEAKQLGEDTTSITSFNKVMTEICIDVFYFADKQLTGISSPKVIVSEDKASNGLRQTQLFVLMALDIASFILSDWSMRKAFVLSILTPKMSDQCRSLSDSLSIQNMERLSPISEDRAVVVKLISTLMQYFGPMTEQVESMRRSSSEGQQSVPTASRGGRGNRTPVGMSRNSGWFSPNFGGYVENPMFNRSSSSSSNAVKGGRSYEDVLNVECEPLNNWVMNASSHVWRREINLDCCDLLSHPIGVVKDPEMLNIIQDRYCPPIDISGNWRENNNNNNNTNVTTASGDNDNNQVSKSDTQPQKDNEQKEGKLRMTVMGQMKMYCKEILANLLVDRTVFSLWNSNQNVTSPEIMESLCKCKNIELSPSCLYNNSVIVNYTCSQTNKDNTNNNTKTSDITFMTIIPPVLSNKPISNLFKLGCYGSVSTTFWKCRYESLSIQYKINKLKSIASLSKLVLKAELNPELKETSILNKVKSDIDFSGALKYTINAMAKIQSMGDQGISPHFYQPMSENNKHIGMIMLKLFGIGIPKRRFNIMEYMRVLKSYVGLFKRNIMKPIRYVSPIGPSTKSKSINDPEAIVPYRSFLSVLFGTIPTSDCSRTDRFDIPMMNKDEYGGYYNTGEYIPMGKGVTELRGKTQLPNTNLTQRGKGTKVSVYSVVDKSTNVDGFLEKRSFLETNFSKMYVGDILLDWGILSGTCNFGVELRADIRLIQVIIGPNHTGVNGAKNDVKIEVGMLSDFVNIADCFGSVVGRGENRMLLGHVSGVQIEVFTPSENVSFEKFLECHKEVMSPKLTVVYVSTQPTVSGSTKSNGVSSRAINALEYKLKLLSGNKTIVIVKAPQNRSKTNLGRKSRVQSTGNLLSQGGNANKSNVKHNNEQRLEIDRIVNISEDIAISHFQQRRVYNMCEFSYHCIQSILMSRSYSSCHSRTFESYKLVSKLSQITNTFLKNISLAQHIKTIFCHGERPPLTSVKPRSYDRFSESIFQHARKTELK